MGIEHIFSKENYYMFGFNYNSETEFNEVIVGKPSEIRGDKVLFHFMYGHHSCAELISQDAIIAVGDAKDGYVSIKGYQGKYTILNQKLFDQLVGKKAIELREIKIKIKKRKRK